MRPRSLLDCFPLFLPQLRASPTSAPHPPAFMPTCRSTIFPTQRPFLRLATSRYVLSQGGMSVMMGGGDGVTCSHLSRGIWVPTCRLLSLPQKHPEPFFALAKELYPGQFKVSSFLQGEQKRLRDSRHGKGPLDHFYYIVIKYMGSGPNSKSLISCFCDLEPQFSHR